MDFRYELDPLVVGQRPNRQSASSVPIPAPPSGSGRRKAKKQPTFTPTFTQYSDASWKAISRYGHLDDGKQWGKIIAVSNAVEKLFKKIAGSVEPDSCYDIDFQALDAMLNIWDHCFALQGSRIGKEMRDCSYVWLPQFIEVLGMATPEDLRRLGNENYPTEPPMMFLKSARATIKQAKSFCVPLEDQLRDAIAPVVACELPVGPPPPGATRDEPLVLD